MSMKEVSIMLCCFMIYTFIVIVAEAFIEYMKKRKRKESK
jgi:hypothetical protein